MVYLGGGWRCMVQPKSQKGLVLRLNMVFLVEHAKLLYSSFWCL
jgi:hypothetical protein